jgi:hypothetical protein
MGDQQQGLLGRMAQGAATAATTANLAAGLAGPMMAPPAAVCLDPALEASAIQQEIDPEAACPGLEGALYTLGTESDRAVQEGSDYMEVQAEQQADAVSEALDQATAFESEMSSVAALDIDPAPIGDLGFDPAMDFGGPPGGDMGGMAQ